MRDDDKMKEITKVARTCSLWGCGQKFLLIMLEGSRGHVKTDFFDKLDKHSAPNGPKEDERVARGHFHERVGESPRRYENFGTSGSPVAFFVSEIRPFENCLGSKSNFK